MLLNSYPNLLVLITDWPFGAQMEFSAYHFIVIRTETESDFYLWSCNKEVVAGLRYCESEVQAPPNR